MLNRQPQNLKTKHIIKHHIYTGLYFTIIKIHLLNFIKPDLKFKFGINLRFKLYKNTSWNIQLTLNLSVFSINSIILAN